MYLGIKQSALNRLQLVHNAAAGLLTGIKKGGHITAVFSTPHWLPVATFQPNAQVLSFNFIPHIILSLFSLAYLLLICFTFSFPLSLPLFLSLSLSLQGGGLADTWSPYPVIPAIEPAHPTTPRQITPSVTAVAVSTDCLSSVSIWWILFRTIL